MNQPNTRPSLSLAFNLAWTHTGRILFQPFDLGRWFIIGFGAWLATLGEHGFGFSGGNNPFQTQGVKGMPDLHGIIDQVHQFISSNWTWMLPVAAFAILLAVGIGLLIMWLNSRGRFILLHCVANNAAEVKAPWNQFAHAANRLFLFRLAVAVASAFIWLPISVFIGFGIFKGITTNHWDGLSIALMVAIGLLFLLPLGLLTAIALKLTTDFVVPIMFKQDCGPVEAWKRLWPIVTGHFGGILLYLLFSILLAVGSGIAVFALVIVTCCIACCPLAIPYIGTVLLLPIPVFLRSFSAFYFGQLAPEYDVFPEPSPLRFG